MSSSVTEGGKASAANSSMVRHSIGNHTAVMPGTTQQMMIQSSYPPPNQTQGQNGFNYIRAAAGVQASQSQQPSNHS